MAVPEQIPVVNYVADGIVKKFDVPFEYDQQSDLHVYVDGAEPTIDKYFFADNSFNFYIAPTVGQDVKIKRITPKERDTDYNLHTNTVRPRALNTDFDRLWYVLQEVFSDVGGLSQAVQDEIIARIQGDEDLLNQLTAEISARMLGDESVTEDLKNYVNQVVGAIIGDPSFAGIDAKNVNDASGETQQQVNYNGGSKWHSRVGGYKLNERVVLTNGDIVKSAEPNNTTNPNLDMTGWVFDKDEINVKDYGAVWNGNSNPVSDWYTIGSANYRGYMDLAAVQAKYPFVSSGTDEIDFIATQAAANDALLKGAEVHLPHGTGLFNRTVNLTGFYGNHITNMPVLHNKKLRFVGKGSANTIIKGGEVGYGFFEMLGANFIDFEGLTLNATNATNKCQYGICAGRPDGNASSGTFHFKDFHIYGFFTKTAHYMMSSETNVWEDCFYYPQTGHGVVLSMNNIGWNVSPKYSTFGTGLGGNGLNYMSRVHFLTHLQSAPTDILLAVEYGQVFRADTIYFASTVNEKHVQFRKSFGQTFINNAQHEQYGAVMPISYYFKGDDPADADDYIDYRDFTLINSRLFQVYSEDNVRLTNANITNNVYRGPVGSLGIDLAKLYDSRIEGSDRLPNVTLNSNVKVRVRQENENNTWKGFKLENIDVPLLALDHVVLPTDSSKAGEISGLDTRLSTVQSGGSAPITAVGTSDFTIYLDFVAPTIIDVQQRGVISFAGASTNMGSGRVLGAYFLNGALFIEYLNTSSNIVTLRSTASILQQLGGKRMSLIIMRSGGNIRAFINGYMVKMYQSSLVGSASFSESIDGAFLMIGNRNSNVNSVAKGVYYSAALFNAALSDDGALNVHRNGALIASTCVGYWMFNQSSGNTLKALRGSNGSIYGDGNLAGVVAQTIFTKNISTEIVLTAGESNRQYITGATGAALGDMLLTSYDKYMNRALISADVSSAGTIEVTFFNPTAASVTIPTGNVKVVKM